MKLRNGGSAYDWLFVAMIHAHRGNLEEARGYYDRAVAWIDKYRPSNEELLQFRDEAAALLAKDEKP
jgi:hypothetical protein